MRNSKGSRREACSDDLSALPSDDDDTGAAILANSVDEGEGLRAAEDVGVVTTEDVGVVLTAEEGRGLVEMGVGTSTEDVGVVLTAEEGRGLVEMGVGADVGVELVRVTETGGLWMEWLVFSLA